MWRNLKFLHIWHVCDGENASKCIKFMLFVVILIFVAIYALLLQIYFVAIYSLLCGEKINQKLHVWRKNYKYQVWKRMNIFYEYIFMNIRFVTCIPVRYPDQ